MSLKADEVLAIARLARLSVADAEVGEHAAKLGSILEMIDQLQAADTAGIEPMAHPLSQGQRLRDDVATETDRRDDYQRNAPAVHDGLYLVPRVIE